MKDILIIGAGGHGRETVQLIKDINKHQDEWNIVGYVDDNMEMLGEIINGVKVLGALKDIHIYNLEQTYVICAIGSSRVREKMVLKVSRENSGLKFATLVHPSAIISDEIFIQEGSTVFALSLLSTNVKLGPHVVISYGVTVGHDTRIDEFGTILPGCHLAGSVVVKRGAEVGTGASVIQGKVIGENSIVGAGAVVITAIPDGCTAVGIPAKPIKFLSIE